MMKRLLFLAAALLALPQTGAAQAVPDDVVRAEVIGGWQTENGTQMAALRLTLADGWKTYWRAPGDAGIPPLFDWSGSGNIAGVRFHWPRPQVFDLGGIRAIGYSHELVLPLEFTPSVAGGEVIVTAEIELGVCSEVCVPVTLRISQALPLGGAPDADIRSALASVPARAKPRAIHCSVEPLRDGLRLRAEIDIANSGGDEVAVIEVANPSIWISEAVTERRGNVLVATADLVPATAQPFALDRSSVRITILGRDRALDLQGCPS